MKTQKETVDLKQYCEDYIKYCLEGKEALQRKKIYIWGAGSDGRLLMQNEEIQLVVQRVIDKQKDIVVQKGFYDLPVYLPEEVDWDNAFIIIGTRAYSSEVIGFLEKKNMQIYDDYIPFEVARNSHRIMNRYDELMDQISAFSKWIPKVHDKVLADRSAFNKYLFTGNVSAEEFILNCCVNHEHKKLHFIDGNELEYVNLRDLATIITEILIHEDYYFETLNETPTIIDGGANIGLSVYYFKHLYDRAKIIAFEPNPELYTILMKNIEANGWKDVKVYPFALGKDEQNKVIFYIQDSCIAGSLEKRNSIGVDERSVKEIEVDEVALSKYIDGEVDYLKLDIEGAETYVIENIEPMLKDVKHVFIEFHEGPLKNYNYISRIISILEKAGFELNVGKSVNSQKKGMFRPMNQVGTRVSENIWAKRV